MFGFLKRKSMEVEAHILDDIDASDTPSFASSLKRDDVFGIAAVFACVRVISEDIAKLPIKLKQGDGDERKTASDQPEHRLLSSIGRQPTEVDDGCTAMEWIEQIIADAALHGVGIVKLNRVGGKAVEVTNFTKGQWRKSGQAWELNFKNMGWQQVDRNELFVLKGPQLGADITNLAAKSIHMARAFDVIMSDLLDKSGRPNGIMSSEKIDSQSQAVEFVNRINSRFGRGKKGGIVAVDLGEIFFERISLTPEELEIDGSYMRTLKQICSFYRVQPARVMQEITEHNNASAHAHNIVHHQDCMLPWAMRFTQGFNMSVLGALRLKEGYYCNVNMNGVLRGSPEERAAMYMTLRTIGAMSPWEVARLEDLPTKGISKNPLTPLLTNPNPAEVTDEGQEDETKE